MLHGEFLGAYGRAVKALEIAENYRVKDYPSASFRLGVAGHCIQGLVCLPHCVWEGWAPETPEYSEWHVQHGYFESSIAAMLTPAASVGIDNFDLYSQIDTYRNGAQEKWDAWLQTYDATYVQEGLNLATSLTANAWCQALSIPPSALGKEVPEFNWLPYVGIGATVLVLAVVIATLKRGFKGDMEDGSAPLAEKNHRRLSIITKKALPRSPRCHRLK